MICSPALPGLISREKTGEENPMDHYLIDIRLMGSVKHQIRSLSNRLQERFNLGDRQVIPHITLVGPFSTHDEKQLVADFTRICESQKGIPKYEVGGYGFFDSSRVIFVEIRPDENLRQYRWQLSQAFAPYCTFRSYDLDSADQFRFHSTLAMKLDWLTYQRIKWDFRNQENVRYQHHPIRVTLLRDSRIVCEYDFVQGRMLSRSQARSKATRKRDFDALKSWADGTWE
jgi:2'-5' RNA ligase